MGIAMVTWLRCVSEGDVGLFARERTTERPLHLARVGGAGRGGCGSQGGGQVSAWPGPDTEAGITGLWSQQQDRLDRSWAPLRDRATRSVS